MRLYGAIEKVEAQGDGTVRVYGIATSEAVDEQGEIVRAAAMRAAMPDYMRFPALREMHQLSAAGTTLEAEVCEDGTTRIVAHVVDPVAVAKVRNNVYRGFSIGGRVTQRDAGNPKIITGLVLNEISLVDRPANPEAIYDCWKAAPVLDAVSDDDQNPRRSREAATSPNEAASQAPFNAPIQIWACDFADHRHLTKAEAVKCVRKSKTEQGDLQTGITSPKTVAAAAASAVAVADDRKNSAERRGPGVEHADPGYQSDGKQRYPIDTDRHIRAAWNYINKPGNASRYTEDQLKRIRAAIIAAWKARINNGGPPSIQNTEKAVGTAVAKALWDVCHVVRVIMDLDWLKNGLDLEGSIGDDALQEAARLQEIIAELCDFLTAMVNSETDQLLDGTERDGLQLAPAMSGMLAMAAGTSGIGRTVALLEKGNPHLRQLAKALLVKSKPSRADQALMNIAYRACDRCLKTAGLSPDERDNMVEARDRLEKAGALVIPDWAADTGEEEARCGGGYENVPASVAGNDAAKVLEVIALTVGKRGRAHQQLMDLGHGCIGELTDGAFCGGAAKIGARHSKETMQHLEAAHGHLTAAGANCDSVLGIVSAAPSETDLPVTELALDKADRAEDVAKQLAGERLEKAKLVKVLGEIVPRLDQLTKRVDEIARTPLPPLTMARDVTSISKQQDRGGTSDGGTPEISPEAVTAALSKMSKEEQTLTLIKASYANPIRVLRSVADE
jgi:hypothetical protein